MTTRLGRLLSVALTSICLLLADSVEAASITVFNSEAQFNLDARPNQTASFNSFVAGSTIDIINLGPATISGSGPLLVFGPGFAGFTTNFLSKAAAGLVFNLAPGTEAFGMKIVSIPPVSIRATGFDNASAELVFTSSSVAFIGFSSVSGIKLIEFSDLPSPGAIVNIGDLSYRTNAFDICLQDGTSVLTINSNTGEYLFSHCGKGLAFAGKGKITRRFCKIDLLDGGPDPKRRDRSVSASFNACTNSGTASVAIFSQWSVFRIADPDTTNNVCACR